jgi:hypothetical protein
MHPIVERYCRAVNSADDELMLSLFAPDGVLQHPSGTYADPETIRGFYRDLVMAGQTRIDAAAVVADGPLVMAEIIARSPLNPDQDARTYAIDVFRLDDDGRITALDVYYR